MDVEKVRSQDRSLRNALFRRRNLLCLLSRVVRVKLRFWTSFMIILIRQKAETSESGRSLSSLQVRPRCQKMSYIAVRLTNTTAAFFLASKYIRSKNTYGVKNNYRTKDKANICKIEMGQVINLIVAFNFAYFNFSKIFI